MPDLLIFATGAAFGFAGTAGTLAYGVLRRAQATRQAPR